MMVEIWEKLMKVGLVEILLAMVCLWRSIELMVMLEIFELMLILEEMSEELMLLMMDDRVLMAMAL